VPRLIRDCLVEKIWEGTINILALDLMRAANKASLMTYEKWLQGILSQTPKEIADSLQPSIKIIRIAKDTLFLALSPPLGKLTPRPALVLFGYLSCAAYLLEHAIWCFHKKRNGFETDIQCVKFWVEEGMEGAVENLRRYLIRDEEADKRIAFDRSLLYGTKL